MAKNIEEYVVSKVIEHLDVENKLQSKMFELLKQYHKSSWDQLTFYIGDCKMCGRPCIFDYSKSEGYSNCLPCMDCNDLYCEKCMDNNDLFVYYHSYSYESKLPDVLCLDSEKCPICNDDKDESWLSNICKECHPTHCQQLVQ
jgi:hypothetical protein